MPEPAAENLATLLVSCPDRRGLVAALSQLLFGHGANILDADQHSDPVQKQFFQRIRFDASELLTDRATLERGIEEVAARFDMTYRISWCGRPKRLAIMVSKYEHCLVDLLYRHRSGEIDCEVPLIISNHQDLKSAVESFGIAFHYLPITEATRAEQETRVLELLTQEEIDVIVLARYMQILSPRFARTYENRIINIHHSFLPAFVGGKPYHQAHSRGVKIVGVTAHYVTEKLDEGPIIEQDVVRCSHRDNVEDLVRKGRDLEKVALARAVRWHIEDRVLVYGNKTVVFD